MSELFEGWGVGQWLMVGIVIFLIGNFSSGQSKPHELMTETLRLMAKRKQLYPKLAPTPQWLNNTKTPTSGSLGDYSKQTASMTMQYSLLVDDWQLPQSCYIAADNHWRYVSFNPLNAPDETSHPSSPPAFAILNGEALNFETLNPFIIAIATKANHIVLFWRDEAFVRQTKPNHDDLEALTDHLLKTLMATGNAINKLK